MPVEQRPAASRPGAPVSASKPQIYLRLPDVFAEEPLLKTALHTVPSRRPNPSDSLGEARAKLSEKRFLDGHRQVTSMIEGLRNRRQRLFRHLWYASVTLTALSVVALAVEVVHRMDFLNSIGDTVETSDPHESAVPSAARDTADGKAPRAKPGAPRAWSNALPADSSVESAVYEKVDGTLHQGAWLQGTIADQDSDRPHLGTLHDDHQSRAP